MRHDPAQREPRALAVGIWTLSGLLMGVAMGIVLGAFPLPQVIFGLLGLAFGLFTTRHKEVPDDD